MHCNAEFYYVGRIPHTAIGRTLKQRRVVLRRRNTTVGGRCALPSALLVIIRTFLPRDAMYKRGLCRHAVSVCLCVRVSVTFVDRVETNKDIFDYFHHRVATPF